MPKIEMKIEGLAKLRGALDRIAVNLRFNGEDAMKKAAQNTAEDIQVIFKGGASPGFQDRTGALRASIAGDLLQKETDGDRITSFVGAGDNTIGSEGKPTREYVTLIEFGEFSRAGKTSFLRAGVQMQTRQILKIIMDALRADKLVGRARRETRVA